MSRFQQGSLLRMKRKGAPDAWVFRWYDYKSLFTIYVQGESGVSSQPYSFDAPGR